MTTRPRSSGRDTSALAAEYVLGVLPAEQRKAFTDRLARDPALAAEVRFWNEHFAGLADGIQPVAPPASLAAELEARLFGKFGGSSASTRLGIWNSLALWRGLALACLTAAVILAGIVWRDVRPSSEALVAQISSEQTPVRFLAYFDEQRGDLRLSRLEGAPAADRSFELWLIAGEDAPVSLGLLADARVSRVAVPETLRPKLKGGVLAVSDEPAGGSPTGAPTGSVLATGSLSPI